MTDKTQRISPTAALIIYRDALKDVANAEDAATIEDARRWAQYVLDTYRIR